MKKLTKKEMVVIHEQLMATGQWGDREIRLGMEFCFECAYCGKDMFESVESYCQMWCMEDHAVAC